MTALNPSVRLVKMSTLPKPNQYVQMLGNEFKDRAFSEETAPQNKGKWRESLGILKDSKLDLEIGTGNGYFFAEYAKRSPERNLLGLELKFKPLIQTIKRSVALGNKNSWVIRYHASILDEIFAPNELDNVFIYFPDPWPKKRHFKNRLITLEFLFSLYEIQKSGSFLEIKTDHEGYFDWILERMERAPYKVTRVSRDLHNSEWAEENFKTHFEKLWTSKGLKTHYLRAEKV